MNRPNFYCTLDTINSILAMPHIEYDKDMNLSIDIIDIPYLLMFTATKAEFKLQVFTRSELADYSGEGLEAGSVTVERASGQGSGKGDPNLQQFMAQFLSLCTGLGAYLQHKGLAAQYANLDPDEAGVLVEKAGDGITCTVVKGKDRPELRCETLLGETVMIRPYSDDFSSRMMGDLLFDEDQLIEDANNGNTDAMMKLAETYLRGDDDHDIDADAEKACSWFEKAANNGNAIAMFNLGMFYAKGYGVKRDFAKATDWMNKAVAKGVSDAAPHAKNFRDMAQALPKAENGDAQAQALLATNLMKLSSALESAGLGENYVDSIAWATKAAAQGNADGCYLLGLAHEKGRCVSVDTEKAFLFYQKAAQLGHDGAQLNIGCLCMARGDEATGLEWWQKSAAQGNATAMVNIGRAYQFKKCGLPYDMDKAIEWYDKSLKVHYDEDLAQEVSVFKELRTPCFFNIMNDTLSELHSTLWDFEEVDDIQQALRKNSTDEECSLIDKKHRLCTIVRELTHTQSKERVSLIEGIKAGDQFTMVKDAQGEDGNYLIQTKANKVIGCLFVPIIISSRLQDGTAQVLRITATSVTPLSQRPKNAKKALLFVRVDFSWSDSPADDTPNSSTQPTSQPNEQLLARQKQEQEQAEQEAARQEAQRIKYARAEAKKELDFLMQLYEKKVTKDAEIKTDEQNFAAIKAAFEQEKKSLNAKQASVSSELSQQGLFAFGAKKELRNQLSALSTQVEKVSLILQTVFSGGMDHLKNICCMMCRHPNQWMTISEIVDGDKRLNINQTAAYIRTQAEKGLITKAVKDRCSTYQLAYYPSSIQFVAMPSDAELKAMCLSFIAEKEGITVQGEPTYNNLLHTIEQQIIDKQWQKRETPANIALNTHRIVGYYGAITACE